MVQREVVVRMGCEEVLVYVGEERRNIDRREGKVREMNGRRREKER